MLEASQISAGDIAIVGMSLRVPGAGNLSQFWENICNGVESIRTYTREELLAAGESAERLHHPNYVPRGAELTDMELFDAEFFGLSPKEAAIMDPQHRQFLECTWEALEDAGRAKPPYVDGPVGIFAGCGMGSYFYFNICSNRDLVDQVGMFLLRHTGNDKDFLATRASFAFDFNGPSVNIQTACSTSLVAVHHACQSLISGECEMALAGGVTIELPHRRGYLFQEGEILSPDGHCHVFDHRADGTVFGSGVGVVVLRRLSDALRDGDVIHAVIKGTAVNNDGSSKAGYLAPSVSGQASAIVEAQGLAGVDADSIRYVECHGTGTRLGDPIEIDALSSAFRQATDAVGFCYVGSVKANIGHLDTAAGVVGLIKAALCVSSGMIPPTIGFEHPNPSIDFERSPFKVNNQLIPWPQLQGPRRAAVNSLGVGGTNAHAILEQAPLRYLLNSDHLPAAAASASGNDDLTLLVLSARQRQSASDMAGRLAEVISRQPDLRLVDTAYTLLNGRKRFDHCTVIAARGRQDAIAALGDVATRGIPQQPLDNPSGAVFMFPGGGAQHVGMARHLFEKESAFRADVEEGLSYLSADFSRQIRAVWFAERDPQAERLFLKPSLQLSAILIVEVALARLWMSWGVQPKALIGHSMGENTAACLAGVMSFQDAVSLVHLRGSLFETIRPSGMLSVTLDAGSLAALLPPSLDIASVNAPSLCVVSGLNDDLDDFRQELTRRGVETSRIPIDIAAHSRHVDGILRSFEAFVSSIALRAPRVPILSNRTGMPLRADEATDPSYWVQHLRGTVLFADGLQTLQADPGLVYIEVGPGRILSSLAKAQGTINANQVINTLPHQAEGGDDQLAFLSALGRAFCAGLDVDMDRLWSGQSARRVRLPTYAFQRKRFFVERADHDSAPACPVLTKEADIERWGYRPGWKKSVAEIEIGAEVDRKNWLFFMDDAGVGEALAGRLRALDHKVVTVRLADTFARRDAENYLLCPQHGKAGYDALLSSLNADGATPDHVVHLWLVTQGEKFRSGSNFFHRNIECGFDSMLHLAQAFGDIPSPPSIHFSVVTTGMQQVDGESLPYAEKATVLGPCLVLPHEMAGATVKVMDIDLIEEKKNRFAFPALKAFGMKSADDRVSAQIDMIWDDLLAPAVSEIVAMRGAKRWTQILQRLPLPPVAELKNKFQRNGIYLFAGGLSDIALSLSRQLVENYNAKIVIVGRTQLPPRDRWDDYVRTHHPDKVRSAIAAINELEAAGGDVVYFTGDVGNPEHMRGAIDETLARYGKIHGVFHAAGAVDDGPLQTKTPESLAKVLTPKVFGTAVLDSVLQDVALDFLVLFSSTSTDVVRAGQVDYVAANAYINAFSQSRSNHGPWSTYAVHWGVWSEIGIAARALAVPDQRLMTKLPNKVCLGPFFKQWIVDEDGLHWLEAEISPRTHWMLDEHRMVSGQAVMPGTGYLEAIAQMLREYERPCEAEISDLVFLKPLMVGDDAIRCLRMRLQDEGDRLRIVITAGAPGCAAQDFVRHAEAILLPLAIRKIVNTPTDIEPPLRQETAAKDATLASIQSGALRFGRRWDVLRSLTLSRDIAIADLSLDACFTKDLAEGVLLHPALLDIATGVALELSGQYRADGTLWVPATYRRARIHGTLPAEIKSIVRLNDASELGEGYAAFDVTITDRAGKILFEAESLVMHRIDSPFVMTADQGVPVRSAAEKPKSVSRAAERLGVQVRNGIAPAEGFDALCRVLQTNEPQPVVSSIDLTSLRAWLADSVVSKPASSDSFERPDLESEFISPRDLVEERIAAFWRELLGVAQIGVHDDFFGLGGHSLIAVRLFRMIKAEFDIDLPISLLFEAPTIAQCADKIRTMVPDIESPSAPEVDERVETSRPLHLVLMNACKRGDASPLFICAGMFGNVLNLRHLAASLEAQRSVYGLQAKGLYGNSEPHCSFEDMAADYIREIRTVQASGPYLLAGYSGGGITALEIARQLKASGEVVAHVIMLDTPLPRQPGLGLHDRLTMKVQDIRRHKLDYLRKYLRDRAAFAAARHTLDQADQSRPAPDQFNDARIESAFRQATQRYTISPYDGSITLFKPHEIAFYTLPGGRSLKQNRDILLPDNGWRDFVSDLTVCQVAGDHDSMVLEPHVRVLADRMRTLLSMSDSRKPAFDSRGAATVTSPSRLPIGEVV